LDQATVPLFVLYNEVDSAAQLRKGQPFMTIHAVIFDLGGVLLEIDWERYQEDKRQGLLIENLWPYEMLNSALAQFLVNLRPRYKVAILSNGGSREAMNRKFRLNELVDLQVFDGEEGVAKPDPRIYQRTLTRLGVQPEESVFVDDTESNINVAQRLGIHAIHFKSTTQAITEIQAVLQRM
jgi:FMN phosphatase YigB (HAD superfamily)